MLQQTYKTIEVLIIDDCSSDKTRDVVIELHKKDSRIKCFFQSTNKGAAIARNIGIQNAKGRYIAFIDADDLWEPEKLSIQMQVIKNGHPFVYCAYNLVASDGKQLAEKCKIKNEVTYRDELTSTYINTPTVIYDKEYLVVS